MLRGLERLPGGISVELLEYQEKIAGQRLVGKHVLLRASDRQGQTRLGYEDSEHGCSPAH